MQFMSLLAAGLKPGFSVLMLWNAALAARRSNGPESRLKTGWSSSAVLSPPAEAGGKQQHERTPSLRITALVARANEKMAVFCNKT